MTLSTANAEVTSVTVARASAGMCASSQARSRRWSAAARDDEEASGRRGASRSGRPRCRRGRSATACRRSGRGSTATSLAQIRLQHRLGVAALDAATCRSEVWSNRPTASRTARCSPAELLEPVLAPVAVLVARRDAIGGVPVRALPAGRLAEARRPRAASRSWSGERRTPRAVSTWRNGQCMAYSRPRTSVVRSWR